MSNLFTSGPIAAIGGIGVLLGFLITFGSSMLVGKLKGPPKRCASCKQRTMVWIDRKVCYDSAPKRTLHRCASCGTEMVHKGKTWTARSDWPNAKDREMFDTL